MSASPKCTHKTAAPHGCTDANDHPKPINQLRDVGHDGLLGQAGGLTHFGTNQLMAQCLEISMICLFPKMQFHIVLSLFFWVAVEATASKRSYPSRWRPVNFGADVVRFGAHQMPRQCCKFLPLEMHFCASRAAEMHFCASRAAVELLGQQKVCPTLTSKDLEKHPSPAIEPHIDDLTSTVTSMHTLC